MIDQNYKKTPTLLKPNRINASVRVLSVLLATALRVVSYQISRDELLQIA